MGRLGSSRKKKKRTLTGDILEPIRDQRKRGNLCTGQRKRNSPSGRPQGTPTHHRSREERRSHRTETPDAGAAFQERGGGRRARQTRRDSRGLSRDSQPQASVTEQPGCAHSAGPGKPDAGRQSWNHSDGQRGRRHQDDKVTGPGQGRDSGQGSREARGWGGAHAPADGGELLAPPGALRALRWTDPALHLAPNAASLRTFRHE